jgi:hypothetical protein
MRSKENAGSCNNSCCHTADVGGASHDPGAAALRKVRAASSTRVE